MIANAAVRDERLTFKARGILAYLLSQAEGWDTSIRRLAETGPDGDSAVRAGVKELVDAGYLAFGGRSRGEDGGYTGSEWLVTDTIGESTHGEPVETGEDDAEAFDYPRVDNPRVDNPRVDNPRTKKNKTRRTPEEEQTTTDVVVYARAESLTFEDFWREYPRHVAKPTAQKAWDKALKTASADVIVAGARRFRDDPNREDTYTPHPSTWLNQGRWDDDPLPGRTVSAPRKLSKIDQNLAEYNRLFGDKHEPARSLPTPDRGLSQGWENSFGDVGRSLG